MTMLGFVRRRQVDDDRTLDTNRPASSNRSLEFYWALMVEAQRLQLEYKSLTPLPGTEGATQRGSLTSVFL